MRGVAVFDGGLVMLEVIQVGSPVTIGENIRAAVTGVLIREHRHVTYERDRGSVRYKDIDLDGG